MIARDIYIIYHLSAGIFQWSQEKGVLGEDHSNLLQESKARVRSFIKEKTQIAVFVLDPTGKDGINTTGNVAHALLSNEKILPVLVSKVSDVCQKSLNEYLTIGMK